MSYLTSLLASGHEKADFLCGNDMLDNYLHKQAKQDMKRKLSACFVLSDDDGEIKGYYTLSSASIQRKHLPEFIIKKLPPAYNDLPVTLLGSLAVDVRFKGQGIGKLLLIDALKRSYETSVSSIAAMAIVVDPINAEAINFYSRFGFISLPDSGRMFIAMNTVEQLFYAS
jgi:ribosomal protein S18 acetylase RimI-like enzyme